MAFMITRLMLSSFVAGNRLDWDFEIHHQRSSSNVREEILLQE